MCYINCLRCDELRRWATDLTNVLKLRGGMGPCINCPFPLKTFGYGFPGSDLSTPIYVPNSISVFGRLSPLSWHKIDYLKVGAI